VGHGEVAMARDDELENSIRKKVREELEHHVRMLQLSDPDDPSTWTLWYHITDDDELRTGTDVQRLEYRIRKEELERIDRRIAEGFQRRGGSAKSG
jgi:hypothetical protein